MKNTEKTSVSFILNDAPQTIYVNPLSRFSEVLREDLGLTGTKVGCDAVTVEHVQSKLTENNVMLV
jgi:aldehyde oxidoreductase